MSGCFDVVLTVCNPSCLTTEAEVKRLYLLECSSEARVYHLGIFREKVSLHPVECEFWHMSLSAPIPTIILRGVAWTRLLEASE